MIERADFRSPRPDFTAPPVVEVALSVGFAPLAGYTNAHSGLFWQRCLEAFATVEEHPPFNIPPVTESAEPARQEVEIVDGAPPIRTWLVAHDGSELLQLQRDNFAHNWRKTEPTQPYPRYEAVRSRFEEHFGAFITFAKEQNLGDVEPRQCDITYVNHVPVEHVPTAGELQEVVLPWSWPKTAFLPRPDHARFSVQFVIRDDGGKFAGRLTVEAKPAYRLADRGGVIVLSMIARGGPIGAGVEGALAFFDLGREWIVRGFTDLTTPGMHKLWGRTR